MTEVRPSRQLRRSRSAAPRARRRRVGSRLLGTFLPRLICRAGHSAGMGIRRCARLAPAYVAKPTTVVMAIPHVITDPAFLKRHRRHAGGGGRGPRHRAGLRHHHRPADGTQPMFERAIRHYVNGFYAMPMIVVLPLFSLWFGYSRRDAHRHHHLRRDILHHRQCRRRRALGAARISRGRALVPLRPPAHAGRDRAAGVDALSAGRFPARRRPRADRRGGGGIFPLDRRARLLHSLQFALLSSQRSLRRRAVARRLRRRLRVAGELVHAAFHAVVRRDEQTD